MTQRFCDYDVMSFDDEVMLLLFILCGYVSNIVQFNPMNVGNCRLTHIS